MKVFVVKIKGGKVLGGHQGARGVGWPGIPTGGLGMWVHRKVCFLPRSSAAGHGGHPSAGHGRPHILPASPCNVHGAHRS